MEGRRRGGSDSAVQRSLERAYARTGTVFGETQSRFLARCIGTFAAAAAVLALIAAPFPAPEYAIRGPYLWIIAVVAALLATLLLGGVFDQAPPWSFEVLLALTTAIVGAACYTSGSPLSGAGFFFLWGPAIAFAFFSFCGALVQLAWMAVGYAAVLSAQDALHPSMASIGVLIPYWLIAVLTTGVIGAFVRRISRSLRDVDRRLQRTFADSPIACGFLTGDLVFQQANPALLSLLDRPREAVVGQRLLSFVAVEDRAIASRVAEGLGERTLRREFRLITIEGGVVWCAASAALVDPEVGEPYVFMQFVDVTDHVLDRDTLAHQAIHDPLTGLFNRTLLTDRLAAALRYRQVAGSIAVLMLDLDQFKVVNDSLGHEVGDELLAALAPRLSRAVGARDTLARFGGDEFVVLCEDIRSPFDAIDRADVIAAALDEPVSLSTGEYTITASIGVATSTDQTESGQGLLRDADAAMYRAKAGGRNRIEIFDQSMREQAVARLELENDLRNAAARGELIVEYQPIVEASTGRVVYFEALVRWEHPVRGLLGPSEFIPLAEETGLIDQIGEYVLARSLDALARWQNDFPTLAPFGVTVNVSGRQLLNEGFPDRVAALLRSSSIQPRTLGLELTESVLLGKALPPSVLTELRSLGVTILLDDFGTGYSSLAYLEQFAIDVLKVDQAFVARLDEGPHRTVVLEAILTMARALDLGVVAEGAESEVRVQTLRALGCNWVQGFGVCRPLAEADVSLYLTEQTTISAVRRFGGPPIP